MFLLVRLEMRLEEFSSSGAMVTSLRVSDEVAVGPYTSAGGVDGWKKREALWAPFLEGWRYGPSA